MTVDIRTLRVSAEVDGGKFKAGADQVIAGANGMGEAMRQVGVEAAQVESKIGRAGDAVQRLKMRYIDGAASVFNFGKEFNSLSTQIEKGKISLEQADLVLQGITKRFGVLPDEIQRARAEALGLGDALKKLDTLQSRSPANNNSTNRFLAGNLAAQGQDVLVTALMGMNPGTIGFQQGGQAAGALQMSGVTTLGGAAKALGAGLAELVNPLTLATIGLTAGAAAAIQFGVKLYEGGEKAKSASDILKQHEESIKAVADAYGGAMKNLQAYADVSRSLVDLQSRTSNIQLEAQLRTSQKDFLGNFGGTSRSAGRFGQATQQLDFTANSDYKPFQEAFRELQATIKDGNPKMDEFYTSVKRIADSDPKLQEFADKIVNSVGELDKFARAVSAAREAAVRTQINNSGSPLDPLGVFNPANDQNAAADRTPSLYQRQQNTLDAFKLGLNAKTPEEKAAAARAQAAAQFNPSESTTARDYRIELAGTQALLQAQKELADAQKSRRLDLEKTVQDAQFEIQTIDKTGGEIAALRKEYELTSALRLEAAKNGTKVDESEIELIKQKAAELGKLTDAYNQQKFNYDIGQQYGTLGRTARQNQVYSTLQQYGLPTDLNSPEAGRLNRLYDAQQMKTDVHDFVTSFGQELSKNGGDIGKAFGTALENALLNQANRLWDKLGDMLGTILTKALMGGDTGGVSGLGGLLGKAVTGGVTSTVGGSLLKGYRTGDVTSAPLGSIPNTDVASYITQAALSRGIDPSIALKVAKSEGGLNSWNMQSGVFKNGVQEPSFGPYQLYMNGGLGSKFMSQTGLDPRLATNGPAGVDFALDYAKQNGWGSWYGAAKVGVGKWDGIGGNSASDAVNKLADSAKSASGNLTQFGNGLNNLGSGMSQAGQRLASSAAGGGGGLLSGLSSIGMSIFGSSAQFASAWKLGGIGLYADGTESAPGGMAIVGERGPELVNLPRGSQVVPTHRMATAMQQKTASSGTAQSREVHIHIDGANGDDHVRTLVQQGVQQGLSTYNEGQRRGGVGALQARYSNQKG